jgi:hypothetical protein
LRVRVLYVLGLCYTLLPACSQSNLSMPPARAVLVLPTANTLIGVTNLMPVSSALIQRLGNAFQALRGTQSAFGGLENNGHGQDGYLIQAPLDANHATFIAVHSVWIPGQDIVLNQPPANGNGYYLYAPTTHPPNACIESGVAYTAFPGVSGTQSYIYFYDFCKSGGFFAWYANDATFRSQYVFQDSNTNRPSTAVLITTLNSSLAAPDWYAYVLNVSTSRWDLFYTSTYASRSASPLAYGWSIFEPNFQPQPIQEPCKQPRISPITVDDLEFYNLNQRNVTPVDGNTAVRTTLGACVTADASGLPSYAFTSLLPDQRWEETATGW